jgi:hypothetical protein
VDRTKLDVKIGDLAKFVNRKSLLAMAADRSFGTVELCISIFAWGGMHGQNRKHLFERPLAPWVGIANQVRDGMLSRSEAYDSFARLPTQFFQQNRVGRPIIAAKETNTVSVVPLPPSHSVCDGQGLRSL